MAARRRGGALLARALVLAVAAAAALAVAVPVAVSAAHRLRKGAGRSTPAAEVCTAYSSKSGCEQYPAPDPNVALPACGGFASALAGGGTGGRRKQQVFAVIGDFGITDGGCTKRVAALVQRFADEFGRPAAATAAPRPAPAPASTDAPKAKGKRAGKRGGAASNGSGSGSGSANALDFVLSTGDNNYWHGNCDTFEQNAGQFFGAYYPQSSLTCVKPDAHNSGAIARAVRRERDRLAAEGIPRLRFFPTYGNHDWDRHADYPDATPYIQYWPYLAALEGGAESAGQYYTHSPHPGLRVFAVNSNVGHSRGGANRPEREHAFADAQMQWLEHALGASRARYRLLLFHHPVHSTAQHDPPAEWMDFPYDRWGATAVFTGHQHCYERLVLRSHNHTAATAPKRTPHRDDSNPKPWRAAPLPLEDDGAGDGPGIPWITNGIGGHPWLYELHHCAVYPGSQARYNTAHGAMLAILSVPDADAPEGAGASGPATGYVKSDGLGSAASGGGLVGDGSDEWRGAQQTLDFCFYSLENGATLVDHFTL